MLDQGNRTFIGSVVFVDIVGYSKKTVSDQIIVKDRFTALLSDALVDIPQEQRLILDTGDGAALSFLGDPEDALFVSMSMRDIINRAAAQAGISLPDSAEDATPDQLLPLRIGINLGPVKLVRDINGHPNIVGDGINVAQRIMSFAQPGQIVVSRSFYDVVSVISDEYAKLFRYEGSRTDKHVREHEIYVVGESAEAFSQAKAGMVDRAASTNPLTRPQGTGNTTGTFRSDQAGEPIPFFQDQKKLTIAYGTLGAIVLALLLAVTLKKPADKPGEVTSAPIKREQIAKTETEKLEPPKTETAAPPIVATDAGKAADPTAVPPVVATGPVIGVAAPPDTKTATAKTDTTKTDTAKADAAKAAAQGTLGLQINPWGDVYINGKSIGVSPPMKQYNLAPGKYKIEVKNTSFSPFVTSVEIKAKESTSIKHTFR